MWTESVLVEEGFVVDMGKRVVTLSKTRERSIACVTNPILLLKTLCILYIAIMETNA